uniref:Rho-GAP domain-containing protein n=1 Tax=Stegastes partitus TaxID=144197 RepID=A0A3B4Z856_9TELE
MKNKGTKLKPKKKGSENAFGCDLIEHLQSSGQDVPQVLKNCAEFIEKHGIVDGIYRLSGVTSNIQRLRYSLSLR